MNRAGRPLADVPRRPGAAGSAYPCGRLASFLDASWQRLQVTEHNFPVVVLGNVGARGPRELGPPR